VLWRPARPDVAIHEGDEVRDEPAVLLLARFDDVMVEMVGVLVVEPVVDPVVGPIVEPVAEPVLDPVVDPAV